MGFSSKSSLDFAGLGSPCSWAPPLFLLLDVSLLHSWPPHLCDWQFHLVVEESLVPSLAPPFSLLLKSVWVAFWRHYSLFFFIFLSSMCCSFLPSFLWADIACTGDDFRDFRAAYSLGATDCVSGFPPFGQLFYGGLAGPLEWASGGEHLRGLWVLARCMFVFCLTRSHQVLGWSSCLALSNQQACVRPGCFTGRLRPLGTGFFNGSMVLSFWSAPSTIKIPALRVPRYRLAPVDCYLSSPVTGKAPC